MKAAFYKGTHTGLPGIYNRVVRWWTRSSYSHVELIFFDSGRDDDSQAASASYMDGGVRIKWFKFDPALWDFVDLPDHLALPALQWFDARQGDAYDLLGNLHFLFSAVGDDKQKWFCSEACAAALGMPNPERFDPGTLHAALTFLSQPASAGFFLPIAKGNQ